MGCLPMFLQIPVFLGLFHVLRRLDPDNADQDAVRLDRRRSSTSASHAKLFTAPIAGEVRLHRRRARRARRQRHHREDRRRRPGR